MNIETSSNVNVKINSKKIIILFCLLAILVPFIFMFFANSSSGNYDFVIHSYKMDVVVDEFGDMHVVEKVNNVYSDTNVAFYKNLIYSKNNSFSSSKDVSTLIEDVRVIVEEKNIVIFDTDVNSNTNYRFVGYSYNNDKDELGDYIKCEDLSSGCEMIFYYDRLGIGRNTTFTYEYTIKGAVTKYSDIAELNWVFLGEQPMKVKNIEINITLPEGDYDIANESTFFHGSTDASRSFVSDNKVKITADQLKVGEKIEARLLVDKEVFSSVRSQNTVLIDRKDDIIAFEEDQIKTSETKLRICNSVIYGLFALGLLFLLVTTIKVYKKYDKEYKSDFDAEYYRELPGNYPPAVMGYLYKFKEINKDDLSATLLDLIRRKYLILDASRVVSVTDNNPDYIFKLNKEKDRNDLTELENHLIEWYINGIGDGNQVSSKEIVSYSDISLTNAEKYQQNSKKFFDLVDKEGRKYNFFVEDSFKGKCLKGAVCTLVFCGILWIVYKISNFIIGGMFSLSLLMLTIAYVCYITSIKKRTQQGNEDYVRWKAFKNFLEDFSNFEDYPVQSIVLWDHYLVYAASFGIADKVMKQLKLKLNFAEFVGNGNLSDDISVIIFCGTHRSFINDFNRTLYLANSVSHSRIAEARARSSSGGGSSFGGGFSGGSSFGGGGGSFGGR